MSAVRDLISEARRAGIIVVLRGNKVRIRRHRDHDISQEIASKLKAKKAEIVSHLKREKDTPWMTIFPPADTGEPPIYCYRDGRVTCRDVS